LKGLLDRPKTPLRKRTPTVRKKYELDIIRIRNNNPTWSKEKIAIEHYQRISELKNRQRLPKSSKKCLQHTIFRKRKGYKNITINYLRSTKRLWVNRKNKEHKTAKKKEK